MEPQKLFAALDLLSPTAPQVHTRILRTSARAVQLEPLLECPEVLDASSFAALVSVQHHVQTLARQDRKVVRMSITLVTVNMMHYLIRSQRSPKMPLCYSTMDVESLSSTWVSALGVSAQPVLLCAFTVLCIYRLTYLPSYTFTAIPK